MTHIAWMLASLLVFVPALAYAVPGTVEVDIAGEDVIIGYDAEGVVITSTDTDTEFASIIFDVDVTGSPGVLEITFERYYFNAVLLGEDTDFIIIADAEEPEFEETKNADSRTLKINLDTGISQVEIIGTHLGSGIGGTQFGTGSGLDSESPELKTSEPEAPAAPAPPPPPAAPQPPEDAMEDVMEDTPKPLTQCGPGTVLEDGECVLDGSCGPGTIFQDGACVLDAPAKSPVSGNRDLVLGAGAGFVISFVILLILWAIGRASRNNTRN